MSKNSKAVFFALNSLTFMSSLLSDLDALFFFFCNDLPALFGIPFDLPEHAGENAHVFGFQTVAAEDAAEGEQHMLGIVRIEKADLEQRSTHNVKEPFDI